MLLVFGASNALAVDAATQQPATKQADSSSPATKDDQSAADRRKAESDFEAEKLDSKAFADSGSGDSAKGSGSSSSGSIGRFLFGLVVVLGVIYAVHWLLKRWGQTRLQGVAGTAGVIDVVATTPLAQGRALHLVRVGKELVLVGATEQSITRIGELDANALAAASGDAGKGEFQSMLAGAMMGSQPGVPQGMGGAGSNDQPFLKRFLDNLRMSTAR